MLVSGHLVAIIVPLQGIHYSRGWELTAVLLARRVQAPGRSYILWGLPSDWSIKETSIVSHALCDHGLEVGTEPLQQPRIPIT